MFEQLKQLLKHSSIYALGNILAKLVGFLMIPVYTRYLTPQDYGIIELLFLATGLVSLFLSGGISSAMTRFYFDYNTDKDRQSTISTALFFIISISLSGALICIVFANKISLLVFNKLEYAGFFRIVFFSMAFEIIMVIPFTYLRILERSGLFITISFLQLIIGLSLNIYLIVLLQMGVFGVLWSGVITSGIVAISLSLFTLKKTGVGFSFNKLIEMVKYGAPLIFSGLGAFFTGAIDRLLLKHLKDLTTIGLYSLGYKFGIMISYLLITPFLRIWNIFMFNVKGKADAREIYSKVLTYFGFVIILATLGMACLIKDVITIVADKSFFEAYKVVPLIAIAFGIRGFNYIFQVGIYLEKKTKYIAYLEWIGTLLNLVLNWFLIPSYGIIGAGLSLLGSYLCLTVSTYLVSNKLYRVKYEFLRLTKMLIVALLLYLGSLWIEVTSITISIILKTGLTLSFPLILYVIGFFEQDELIKIKELVGNFKEIKHA